MNPLGAHSWSVDTKKHTCSLFLKSLHISQVNTFQVALACNSVNSFVFFFYEETNVPSRFVTVGFSPSSSGGSTGQSFMIPRSDTNNIENGTNTGVPGFYAYRTDRDIILQPEGVESTIATLEFHLLL